MNAETVFAEPLVEGQVGTAHAGQCRAEVLGLEEDYRDVTFGSRLDPDGLAGDAQMTTGRFVVRARSPRQQDCIAERSASVMSGSSGAVNARLCVFLFGFFMSRSH